MKTKQFGQLFRNGLPLFRPLLRMKKCGWLYVAPSLCVLICADIVSHLVMLAALAHTFQKKPEKNRQKKEKRKQCFQGGDDGLSRFLE